MSKNLETPKTQTPFFGVIVTLVALAALVFGFLYWLFGMFLGVTILFVALAFTTKYYTETVQGFYAHIVLNHLSGEQRALFQGVNLKLPWEEVQDEKIEIRKDAKEVMEETYTCADSLMDARYVYSIKPDATGDNGGEKIILFASYEIDAIKMEGRALFSILLSDHFAPRQGKDLMNKRKINEEVFENEPGKSLIEDFEEKHGVEVTVRLEDVDFDAATQAARDSISKAKSIAEAIELLMKDKPDGKPGMSQAMAEKTVRMLNIPGIQEHIISLDAKGVENLTNFSLLGALGGNKK